MDGFLNCIKQTLNPDNQIRTEAESNLNALKEENIKELISILIQIITSDYYKENLTTFQASIIYAWNLFPSTVNDIPENPELHPFVVYSGELVQQLVDASFNLMINKGANDEEVPIQARSLASFLYGRIAALQVHYDMSLRLVQKLSEVLASAQTLNDFIPICQALKIICEEFEPEEEEVSALFNTLFGLFESVQDVQILSQLLDVLSKTVTSLTTALTNEEILKNTITTLLNLSTIDGLQAYAFKVWSCIYKNCTDDNDNNVIIPLVADQLIEISIGILANENKTDEDLNAASTLVKQIAKLEYQYDSDEFIPVRSNAQPLIVSLIRVCCTASDESLYDKSYWLPFMFASNALKKVFILLTDEDLESVFPIMKNLATSEHFNERFGGLIILSRIIKYADNEFVGFQFLQSLFELLENDKTPCVIFQAIKCIKNVIYRFAEAYLHGSECQSQEILDQMPQICENSYNMMMQILAISDEQAQEETTQLTEMKADAERSALNLNLSSFSRNNNDDDENEEYLYSPIALQAAGLLTEVSRIDGFAYTSEVLHALFENGLKYQVPKFFDYVSKIIDYGKDLDSVIKFLDTVLEALQTTVQSSATIWALNELGEIIQTYLAKFEEQLEPRASDLLNLLIQGLQTPSVYASDALIPIGMLVRNFPAVLVNTVISEEGQEPMPAQQLTFNALSQALSEVENSELIYKASTCLWFIIMSLSNVNENNQQSIEVLGNDLAQMTIVYFGLLMEAISNLNISLSARRSCMDCIADLANYQPELILPMVDDFIVLLRTFSIFQALNVSLITDPQETQLMLNALARCTLSIMKAVGPENALNYKDIAKDIIIFVSDLTEKHGAMERCCKSTIELLFFIANLDKNYILEIIEKEESVGILIVTSRDNEIPNAQETLDILGYTE